MSGIKRGLPPAVVLSGHTIGLGVIRALGEMGVPVVSICYDRRDMGHVSRYVIKDIFAPHPEESEDKFIEVLTECSKDIGGGILIPADDATLAAVSRHKDLLEQHYIVACTGWDVTRRFVDKRDTYALASSVGVPAPATVVPGSPEEAELLSGVLKYPCLVKPCQSHRYYEVFRRKVVMVHNRNELLSAYREAREAALEVMLQEYIPGDDSCGVNYNSYVWDGRALVEFTAEKVRLSPPVFGVPRVVRSRHVQEIIGPGRRMLDALGFYGYSCMEFKLDVRNGVYKFMEVNGRHNRSALLSVRCGINFPWLQYRHLVLGEPPGKFSYRKGVYWIDEFRDFAHSAKYFRAEGYSLVDYLRPYFGRKVFAVFDRRDLRPFFKRIAVLANSTLRMTLSRLRRVLPKLKKEETCWKKRPYGWKKTG